MKDQSINALVEIADKLAHPQKYTDISGWFTGDGPFETWAWELGEHAKVVLAQIKSDARNNRGQYGQEPPSDS